MVERKYVFYDTFKKSCEFKNGTGECHKTRESKRCIDDKCEIVKIPMHKKEILSDYYSQIQRQGQIQQGSGEEDTYNCPFCNKEIKSSNLIQHTYTHKNEPCMYCNKSNMIGGSGMIGCSIMDNLHKKWWHKNKHFVNSTHFPK